MNCLANSESSSRFQDFRSAADAVPAPGKLGPRPRRDYIVRVDKESQHTRSPADGDVFFSATVRIVDVYNGVGDRDAITDPMRPRLLNLCINNLFPARVDESEFPLHTPLKCRLVNGAAKAGVGVDRILCIS